jgi:hypothetical protein
MKEPIKKFYEFLDRPLAMRSRILLALLILPLLFSLAEPLWQIRMIAPQYPDGLTFDVYAYKLEGGNNGQHLNEINTLNHYIGMKKLNREELADLDWLPFAFGILALLTLRVAAIGNVRSLIDLTVLTTYFSGFSLARFVYKLYQYGHDLDPHAPVHMDPFMPVVLGQKQIANFTTFSYPQGGSLLFGLFVIGLLGVLTWHLVSGRRAAVRAELMAAALPA